MSVDLTEFEALSGPRKKPCPLEQAIAKLKDENDVVKVRAAIAEPTQRINHQAISRWFRARKVRIEWQVVRSHRRCKCND